MKVMEAKPTLLSFLLVFALFFTSQMGFRGSEFAASGQLDMQVFVRLGVLIGVFVVSLPYYRSFFEIIREIPIFFHLFLLVYLLFVTVLPDHFNFYSLYALATHIMMFYVSIIFVCRFGINNVLYYYVIGVFIFCLISLFFYFFIPDIGRYTYWLDDALYQSSRMRGIAGHPNTLGFMTATALITFLHLVIQRVPVSRLIYISAFVIFICLVLTNSRTSMGGMFLMSMVYIALYMRAFILLAALSIIPIILLLLSIELSWDILPELLQMLSRSGDAEEITSLTGRSHVWEQLFVLIEKKPVFGWGYASMGSVLATYKNEIGFDVGQAHNLYLQILFSGGFVGMLIYIISMLSSLLIAILQANRERSPFVLCILLYIMLASFTESIMLSSIANNAYFILIICLSSLAIYCKDCRK